MWVADIIGNIDEIIYETICDISLILNNTSIMLWVDNFVVSSWLCLRIKEGLKHLKCMGLLQDESVFVF